MERGSNKAMNRKQQKKLADFRKWLSECPVHKLYCSCNPVSSCRECGEAPENMAEYYFKFVVPSDIGKKHNET